MISNNNYYVKQMCQNGVARKLTELATVTPVCAQVGGWVVMCLCMCTGWWVGGRVSVYVHRLVGGWSCVCVCVLNIT